MPQPSPAFGKAAQQPSPRAHFDTREPEPTDSFLRPNLASPPRPGPMSSSGSPPPISTSNTANSPCLSTGQASTRSRGYAPVTALASDTATAEGIIAGGDLAEARPERDVSAPPQVSDDRPVAESGGETTGSVLREQHSGPMVEEEEEPRIYVFARRGRRGVDSLVSTRPRLPRLQPNECVVEPRRRRYRARTGKYILEFEVKCVADRSDGSTPKRLWINQHDFEQLWREGRIRAHPDEEYCNGVTQVWHTHLG
ncbi:unnamed protein product [Phytophthora fragariaefolia]|uniref:Unnamed protein product n=1 Tax=Phytophthora fragariaefolia TaxID=1490495 RepID=A0A9W6XRZ8_9STRA|nr:unnamed protein product [Phytophthora fragariaefolia]